MTLKFSQLSDYVEGSRFGICVTHCVGFLCKTLFTYNPSLHSYWRAVRKPDKMQGGGEGATYSGLVSHLGV